MACGMKKANYTVGHSEVVLQLAKIHKANLDLKDGKGKTALARAAQEGTIVIAANLIKYGAILLHAQTNRALKCRTANTI